MILVNENRRINIGVMSPNNNEKKKKMKWKYGEMRETINQQASVDERNGVLISNRWLWKSNDSVLVMILDNNQWQ